MSLHPVYLTLGGDHEARVAAYRPLLLEPLTDDLLSSMRDHMRQERALGSRRFQAMVEKTLGKGVRFIYPLTWADLSA